MKILKTLQAIARHVERAIARPKLITPPSLAEIEAPPMIAQRIAALDAANELSRGEALLASLNDAFDVTYFTPGKMDEEMNADFAEYQKAKAAKAPKKPRVKKASAATAKKRRASVPRINAAN